MSLLLNGVDQFIETASAVITTYPATFCGWIRIANQSANHQIVGVFNGGSTSEWLMLEAQGLTAGFPIDAFSRAGGTEHARTTTGYSIDTWHSVVGVFNSSTDRRAYIDGGSVGQNTDNQTPNDFTRTTIGATGDSSRSSFVDGLLSHIAIFDIAFSAQNISDFASGILPNELGIADINLRTYLPLVADIVDDQGNFTFSATGSPGFSALEPPVSGGVIALTGDVSIGIAVDGTQTLSGNIQLTGNVNLGIQIDGVQDTIALPIWAFFGDSETNGVVADPPSNSPNAVIALLQNDATVYKDGVGGASLEESRQRYLSDSNRSTYSKVIFQESGGQDNPGQTTAAAFETTFLATMRDISSNSPLAEIHYETAYSFRREAEPFRNWGVWEQPLEYNGILQGALATLAGEGITVHMSRSDKEIKELVTEITYDVVCFPDGDASSYHYQAPGNLLIGLSHMVQMGYDVRALDLSPITDVSAPNKVIILDIVDPGVVALTGNVDFGMSVDGVQDIQGKIDLTADVSMGINVDGVQDLGGVIPLIGNVSMGITADGVQDLGGVIALTGNVSMGIEINGTQDIQEKIQLTSNVNIGINISGIMSGGVFPLISIQVVCDIINVIDVNIDITNSIEIGCDI